jgi:hypothetical protein
VVGFDEAWRLVRERQTQNADSSAVAACEEYAKSWVFTFDVEPSFGGFGSPVVVDKATGEVLPYVVALDDGLVDGCVVSARKFSSNSGKTAGSS